MWETESEAHNTGGIMKLLPKSVRIYSWQHRINSTRFDSRKITAQFSLAKTGTDEMGHDYWQIPILEFVGIQS